MQYCLSAVILLIANLLFGQDSPKFYNQDFYLTVDNDAFLIQTIDRYYSSGIFFGHRRSVSENSLLRRLGGANTNKAFYSIGFSHIFHTPSDIKLRTIDQFDRPYAGQMSVNLGVNYVRNSTSLTSFQFDAGVMGPAAGMESIQMWYHDLIGAKEPRGWQFQIENTPLLTANFGYTRTLIEKLKFGLYSENSLTTGTVYNAAKSGISLRWGRFQPIENSTFTKTRLGSISTDTPQPLWKESYLYLKASLLYIPYDASVEGNFIGKKSLHTERTQRLRYHIRYGWSLGLKKWDLGIAFNNVRRETRQSRDHYFVTLEVLLRI